LPSISPKTPSDTSAPLGEGPSYILRLELETKSNNGKSLIHKSRVVSGKGVGQLVDADGGVELGEVRRWVAGVLSDAGLVGAEEEGLKAE
jgi:signal peptidase complex subunit 2